MSNSEKKAILIKKMQEELDRRTAIEEAAAILIENGKYETAIKLLNGIDDSIVKEITEEIDKLKETETVDQENEETEIVQAVDVLSDLEQLQKKVIYSDTFLELSKADQEKIYTYCKVHYVTNEIVKENLVQIRYAVTNGYFGF
ncbi:MAG: hypothetical protein HFJ09_08525 [Lachnospiraceae bacterium]|nr:hypothetical protein [Lachnospiraceae bacterium]